MWGKIHGNADVENVIQANNGCGEQDYAILEPTLIDQNITKKVTKVACGEDHCLLLNIDGEVYSWGGNNYGQLGINSKEQQIATPTKIEEQLAGKRIVKISCGSYFSAAVLDSGEVFTWGFNNEGQLGLNDSEVHIELIRMPERVPNLNDAVIIKIMCGREHVLAMNDAQELFVWGENWGGELGLGDRKCRHGPVKNETIGKVTKIAASSHSHISAALAANSKIYMWGRCAGTDIDVPKETHYESLHEVFAHNSKPRIMYKSMTRLPDYESGNETLKNAFEDAETSDLIIEAEGKEIFVHRAILRLRSEYFRTFLQEHWCSETEKFISIQRQSYDVMYAYLKYLYCGNLQTELNVALELLFLADEYNDRLLKRLCEMKIQDEITTENVASLYSIARKLDAKKLRKRCLSFAGNHMSDLIKSSGFDDWDVTTVKEFFRECSKRKLLRS
ncbi:hypothetical protein V9T40_005068 [Parthenolecanium corni]|uniref:BTB domain-containing protein n=1 Tax=Parthenolecanium corni TaxID=536013 RepID=A0AAN9TDG4_9HEMI